MVRKRQGLPKAVKYCLWANRITLLIVVGILFGFGYKQYLDMESQSSAGVIGYIMLGSKLFGYFSMLVTFSWWILGLNSKLKRLNEKAMTWQVYWSFLFIFAFPIGTLLHLPCLYWMLFSHETYEAFEQGAWEDPKPFKGIVLALMMLMIVGGGAYFAWSQRDILNDLKDMNPLSKMTGGSFDMGALAKGDVTSFIGGDTMARINNSASGSVHTNKILSDLGIGKVGGSPMEALGRATPSPGGGAGGAELYKKFVSGQSKAGGGAGGLSSFLPSGDKGASDVKKPYAMKRSKASLVKLKQAQKSLPERFFEWLDEKFGKEENKLRPLPAVNPDIHLDENTHYDKEAGNVYF